MIRQNREKTPKELAYDALAKQFIRDTRVLAYLFRDCIPEFENEPVDVIRQKIEAHNHMIAYAGGEIPFASGAYIEPDLLFDMNDLRGNVDFQKDKPSYELEARMAVYASALICHQIGNSVKYNSIVPVHSIWITNYRKAKESCLHTSVQYEKIRKRRNIEWMPKRSYMNWSRFEIGRILHEDDLDSAKILYYQFRCKDRELALKELRKYGIGTLEDERRWDEMCNLSEGIFEDGYEYGTKHGEEKGIHKGRIRQAVDTTFSIMEELNIPMEKAFKLVTKNLAEAEKEEVEKQLKLKMN